MLATGQKPISGPVPIAPSIEFNRFTRLAALQGVGGGGALIWLGVRSKNKQPVRLAGWLLRLMNKRHYHYRIVAF